MIGTRGRLHGLLILRDRIGYSIPQRVIFGTSEILVLTMMTLCLVVHTWALQVSVPPKVVEDKLIINGSTGWGNPKDTRKGEYR